jgi:hypothetical protein
MAMLMSMAMGIEIETAGENGGREWRKSWVMREIRTTHKRLHLRDDLVQLALRLLVLLDGLLQACQRCDGGAGRGATCEQGRKGGTEGEVSVSCKLNTQSNARSCAGVRARARGRGFARTFRT